MQRDQSDQEINFKKRARRRLVGAIALVILMVILLPMMLKDRAASNLQEKITINMPNDKTSNEVVADKKPSDFDSNIVPTQPSTQANAETTPAEEPATTPEPAITEPDPEAAAKVETKPDVKPEAKPAPEKTGAKKPNPEKPAAETHETAQKFYVQIGVFSDADNVKRLQAKLSDLGYKSLTESVTTPKGNKIRLKTSIFADRNEAAIALENIKSAGLTGMVVAK